MKKLQFLLWNKPVRLSLSLVFIAALLFLLSVGFSLVLSSNTLYRYSSEAILNGYDSVALQLQDSIERGLDFGRPLTGFVGLNAQLKHVHTLSNGVSNITVFTPQGEVVESLKPPSFTLQKLQDNTQNVAQTQWKSLHDYHLLLPLKTFSKELAGYLVVSVDWRVLNTPYENYLENMFLLIIMLLGMTCFAQLGWFAYANESIKDTEKLRRSIVNIFFIFIAGSQIFFAIITVYNFNRRLTAATEFSAELSGKFLASNLEILENKKLNINNLPGLEKHMQEMLEDSHALGAINVSMGQKLLASVGNEIGANETSDNESENKPIIIPVYSYWQDLHTPRTQIAKVEVFLSTEYREKIIGRMLLDQATSIVISLILLWQLTAFAVQALSSKIHSLKENYPHTTEHESGIPENSTWRTQKLLLEAALFIFFCAYDLVMSFIPLVASDLPSNLLPLSLSIQRSLPISMEACFATVAVIVSGFLNRWLGWKNLLYLSTLSAITGAIIAYISFDVALFIVARAFSGFSMGLILMSAQFCVVENTRERLSGLSGVYAALFAGSICGSASGGMLYDLFDFHTIFLVSACIICLPILLISRLIIDKTSHNTALKKHKEQFLWRSYMHPSFLIPALLVGFPAGMVLTGFLYFVVPTSMQGMGVSQAEIGRLFMLYGLCFVFLGPMLAKFANKHQSQRLFVLLLGLTSGGGVLSAILIPNYAGFVLAVFLVGISQCLMSSSMLEYILALPSMKNADKAITSSAYRLCERSGQIAGPMLCSVLLLQGLSALIPLSIAIFIGVIIFAISSKNVVTSSA